jgi:hypothetical protein
MNKTRQNLKITSSDARILSKISEQGSLTGLTVEMIAIQRGLIKAEGIIPSKKIFEQKVKACIWTYLQAKDGCWYQDISFKSTIFSTSGIDVLLNADFLKIDEVKSEVIIFLCDFSKDSNKNKIESKYKEVSYMVYEIAKEIWRNYIIKMQIIHYDHYLGYLERIWDFDSLRLSFITIHRRKIDIHKAIKIIANSDIMNIDYHKMAICFEDLPEETQIAIEGLKFIQTYLLIFKDRLNDAIENSKWNERRILNYVNTTNLCSLADDLQLFSKEFAKWFNSLSNQHCSK